MEVRIRNHNRVKNAILKAVSLRYGFAHEIHKEVKADFDSVMFLCEELELEGMIELRKVTVNRYNSSYAITITSKGQVHLGNGGYPDSIFWKTQSLLIEYRSDSFLSCHCHQLVDAFHRKSTD